MKIIPLNDWEIPQDDINNFWVSTITEKLLIGILNLIKLRRKNYIESQKGNLMANLVYKANQINIESLRNNKTYLKR